jgi:hypothetical protein
MKILVLTLFLYFSLFAACGIYAGNNTITASYPAPSGAYNKVILQNPTASTIQCTQSTMGMLFTDPVSGNLQLCATTDSGAYAYIPFGQTCFNRFCSYQSPATSCSFNGCPSGFTQDQALVDSFEPNPGSGYYVSSTVCCNSKSGSTNFSVLPTS